MRLIHNTELSSLESIVREKRLTASYLNGNLNEGYGIYKSVDQKFVFFSVIDQYESKYKVSGDVVLYFDPKLLWNRSYYISTLHNPSPDILEKWNEGRDYKKKYKQYYKYTNKVLTKLFKNSISKLPNGEAFQVFQQIAIKNKCDLKYLNKIKFMYQKPSKTLIKLIKNVSPEIKIEF